MTAILEAQKNIFDTLASESQIEHAVQSLEANGIHTLVAKNGAHARKIFLDLMPEDAQIYQDTSMTLDALGITDDIEDLSRFNALRPKLRALDSQTQPDQIVLMGASPDYMVGSVHAVTEEGCVLIGSYNGRELGPYVSGAKNVIWIVGAQKLVKDIEEGLRRVKYALSLENERLEKIYDGDTDLSKLLIVYKERPGRITMILVNEQIGF